MLCFNASNPGISMQNSLDNLFFRFNDSAFSSDFNHTDSFLLISILGYVMNEVLIDFQLIEGETLQVI
jgi:hypothetical protein